MNLNTISFALVGKGKGNKTKQKTWENKYLKTNSMGK